MLRGYRYSLTADRIKPMRVGTSRSLEVCGEGVAHADLTAQNSVDREGYVCFEWPTRPGNAGPACS